MLLSEHGISLLIWIIVFTVVCTIVLFLRFWAARVQKRLFYPDDFMVVFAYANTLALEGATIWGIANGLGAHTIELNNYELGVQFKLIVASGVTWLLATVFVKLSIVWLYTRIFFTKKFKYCAWALMGVIAGYGVAFLCVFMTNCQPISQSWDPVPDGWCRTLTVEELASVSLNMVIDLAIVILPMKPLWGLQVATRSKVAISFMFSIGLLTVGIMSWRIQVTVQSVTQNDFVWGLGTIGLISHLELWLGLIVACVPTLAPLVKKYIRPTFTKWYSGSKRSGPGQLREAQNTIGGTSKRGLRRNYGVLNEEYLELHRSNNSSEADATATPTLAAESETWMNDPDAIRVRHDIQVDFAPHQHAA